MSGALHQPLLGNAQEDSSTAAMTARLGRLDRMREKAGGMLEAAAQNAQLASHVAAPSSQPVAPKSEAPKAAAKKAAAKVAPKSEGPKTASKKTAAKVAPKSEATTIAVSPDDMEKMIEYSNQCAKERAQKAKNVQAQQEATALAFDHLVNPDDLDTAGPNILNRFAVVHTPEPEASKLEEKKAATTPDVAPPTPTCTDQLISGLSSCWNFFTCKSTPQDQTYPAASTLFDDGASHSEKEINELRRSLSSSSRS